jgi:HK97 family phage major capsid protein
MLSPSQRSQRARIAAHASWAKTPDPAKRTSAARKSFLDRFEREVDPDGKLSPSERQRRAESAMRAHGAEAEHRAAMAEGANATGGYLVPSPVAGAYVDLLRDQIAVWQGMSHTLPWDGPGSTKALPVTVTDSLVTNLAEGVDMYPPAQNLTVGRYLFTARPYAAVESWSWELEEDSAVGVSDLVANSFANRMGRAIQSDFFYGDGATVINGLNTAAGLITQFEGGASPPALPTAAAGKAWTAVDAAITATATAKSYTDLIVTSPLCYSKYGQFQNSLFDSIEPTPTVQSYINGTGGPNRDGRFALTTAIKDNITVGADVTDVSEM